LSRALEVLPQVSQMTLGGEPSSSNSRRKSLSFVIKMADAARREENGAIRCVAQPKVA
jgi:hypothetical protein